MLICHFTGARRLHGYSSNGVESWVDSGVISESYRDGDGTALYEVEQLLAHGTTNMRRMLSMVRHDRSAYIYEEPEYTATCAYQIMADGTQKDQFGNPIRRVLATTAFWGRMADIIPPSFDTSRLGDATIRFIEYTEYDAINDRTWYLARDELNPFEVGRSLDG